MPDVDDWLVNFLERHAKRYRPFDWPELWSDEGILFIEVWSRAFRREGVTEADADEASVNLGANPPRYRSDHLPAVLKAVREVREERSSRLRIYHQADPPTVPASERFVWPSHIPRGDVLGLCEYLTSRGRKAAR